MFQNLLRSSTAFCKVNKHGEFLQSVSVVYDTVRRSKHWKPEFKKFRTAKVIKVKLPDFEDYTKRPEDMSQEEIRTKMKKRGILPEHPEVERPMYIGCTGDYFEPYVPPEGDGKVSKITKEGAKQTWEFVEKKGKSFMAIRKVRNYDEDFEIRDFLPVAQDIYVKAHETIAKKDKENLLKYVTEKAYPEIIHNIDRKTIHWKFIQSVEPPRCVHARSTDLITKENMFCQITVRFHTQQMLAVYDRFGRLMHGSEILTKDVLEYVVFEKHLSNRYGVWRVHGKIIPDWAPAPNPGITTFVVKPPPPDDNPSSTEVTTTESKKEDVSVSPSESRSDTPPLAVA